MPLAVAKILQNFTLHICLTLPLFSSEPRAENLRFPRNFSLDWKVVTSDFTTPLNQIQSNRRHRNYNEAAKCESIYFVSKWLNCTANIAPSVSRTILFAMHIFNKTTFATYLCHYLLELFKTVHVQTTYGNLVQPREFFYLVKFVTV